VGGPISQLRLIGNVVFSEHEPLQNISRRCDITLNLNRQEKFVILPFPSLKCMIVSPRILNMNGLF
jgi:hypothetical protein